MQRIAEYQEHTIQTVKDIASDFIEAEKEVIDSFFQSKADRHNINLSEVWNWYNPQRIFENNTVMVNNSTNYLSIKYHQILRITKLKTTGFDLIFNPVYNFYY